jgi:hypothetical protein
MNQGFTNVKVIFGGYDKMKEVGFIWWRGGDILRKGEVLNKAGGR